MIALDTNLLVHAHRRDNDFHPRAESLVRGLAEGTATWAIPWPCLYEFFSIVTHPRIYAPPSTPEQALNQIEAWLAAPTVTLLTETVDHWPSLRALLEASKVAGPMVHDARIAALCQTHGVRELWSADRDFTRFAGVTTVNPLT